MNTKQPHPHARAMVLYAEDATETHEPWTRWQFKDEIDSARWSRCTRHPAWRTISQYRRKPTKKPVDFSVLLNSGIDCMMWDADTSDSVKRLCHIQENGLFVDECGEAWEYCTPRMNHWQAWMGGECPVPEGLRVEAMYRDGMTAERESTSFHWYHRDRRDIIAFRVLGLQDGYCWPWEAQR